LAYFDGAVDAATRQQIEQALAADAALRAELEALAHMQDELAHKLTGVHAPDSLALGEYLLGLLPPDEAAALERQTAAYPHHARELAALRDYLVDLDLPPAGDQAPAAAPEKAESWHDRLQEQVTTLVAQLVESFGGGPAWGMAGVRGGEPAQRIYQAGEAQILIDVQESLAQDGRKAILGLIMGLADAEGATVYLDRQLETIATATVDELGNFVFDAIPPGAYMLVLRGAAVAIIVPGVAID
jgi:anti-sigma factor RsiW